MPARARVYQQPKSSMQSGTAGTHEWVLDFEPAEARRADPLMGWSGSGDTQAQVRLRFETRDEALAYAAKVALDVQVELPRDPPAFKPKAYADNFRFGRIGNWTH